MLALRAGLLAVVVASLAVPAAAGAADLTVGSAPTTATRTDAGGVTTFTGPGTVDRTELLAAIHDNDVRLVAPTIDLGGDVSQSDGTGGLEISGTLDVGTSTIVKVPGDLDVGAVAATGSPLVQLGSLSGNLETDGVSGAGGVVLVGGDVAIDGAITTAGALTTYASGTVSQTAPVSADGGLAGWAGTLALTDAGNAIPDLLGYSATDATLRTSGALDVGGAVNVYGELTLDAGGAITQSASNINVGRLSASATGPIALTRGGTVPNLIWKVGDVSGDGVDLLSARNVVVDGTVDGGADDVTVRGTTQLTLAAGGQVLGDDVVLSTAGAFTNAAGTSPIGAAGRWLVYAATSAGSAFGGLDSGSAPRWDATYATVPPSAVSGTRYLFAEQPQATLTAGDLQKVAGDDAGAAVAAVPVTVSGARPAVAGAYAAAAVYAGTPVGSSAGAGAGAAAGTYAIALGGVTALDGYALTTVPGTLTVAAAPAPVTTLAAVTPSAPSGSPAPAAHATTPAPARTTPRVTSCRLPSTITLTVRVPSGTRSVRATIAGRAATARLSGRSARVSARTAGLAAGRYRADIVARGRGWHVVTLHQTVRLACR
jgi:hypothetical protein